MNVERFRQEVLSHLPSDTKFKFVAVEPCENGAAVVLLDTSDPSNPILLKNHYAPAGRVGIRFDGQEYSMAIRVPFKPPIPSIRSTDPVASVTTVTGDSLAAMFAAAREMGWLDDFTARRD